jgi:hypothetical protein
MAEALFRHCGPSGLASGKPKDRLSDAIQSRSLHVPLDRFAAIAMTATCVPAPSRPDTPIDLSL